MIVNITQEEAWAIFRFVRDHGALGREHDKDQAQRLHAALLHFKNSPGDPYDLEMDTEFAWWVTRQVPDTAMTGTSRTGENVLLKVMAGLAEAPVDITEATEEHITEVGNPYRASFQQDDDRLAEFDRYVAEKEVEK